MVSVVGYILVFLLIWAGISTLRKAKTRLPADVAQDLAIDSEAAVDPQKAVKLGRFRLSPNDPLLKVGLYEVQERTRYERNAKLIPILLPLVCLILLLISGPTRVSNVIVPTALAWGVGYIVQRAKYRSDIAAFSRSINFNLPIVMERIIMAVDAGHDVLSAIRTVVEIDSEIEKRLKGTPANDGKDPVTKLLALVLRFVQAGMKFDQALQSVATLVDVPQVKHAFMHLRLAYLEGGAVIVPLKELSDSTQLYYQESIEEEIAKLPAKATLPLVLTFAGLILGFLTTPLIEVVSIGEKAQQTIGKP